MKELVKSFSEKNEITREAKENVVNEDAMLKETDRLKELSKSADRINEWIANPKLNPTAQYAGGHGVTVNTFIPNTAEQNVRMYNPNYTYLQSNEALELAIKRAAESGSPVNNLGFYEEINWHLNNMGFNSRQPIDIKELLKKMIND